MRRLINDIGVGAVFAMALVGLSFFTAVAFVKGMWKEVTG